MIKRLFSSRKFMAMITGIVTSALTLIIAYFVGEEKAQQLAQSIAGMIMLGVSVYAGSQGIADHGDTTYAKHPGVLAHQLPVDQTTIIKIIEDAAK